MRRSLITALLAAAVVMAATATASAQAAYVGVRGGGMISDLDGFDPGFNGGVVAGYEIKQSDAGSFSIEAEFSTALSKGKLTVLGTEIGEWDVQTIAGYAVYRSPGSTVYFKGKVGVLREDVTFETTLSFMGVTLPAISGSDTGLSLGGGLGISLKKAGVIELEATLVERDIFYVSGGYSFYFDFK